MKRTAPVVLALGLLLSGRLPAQDRPPDDSGAWAFAAGQSPVYHLRTLRAPAGGRAIVAASLDGATACFSPEGRPLWSVPGSGGFPFDLAAADIDGDGRDEVLVASGDGTLYTYGPDGALRWKFARTAPLYQVCVARDRDGNTIILTGGVEQVLYALSPQGGVLNQLKTEHCIRHLRAGDVLGTGDDSVAMVTTSSGLTGILRLFLLNPRDLSVHWHHANLSVPGMNPGKRFFSLLIDDLNRDGKAEVVLSGGWRENGVIHAYDHQGRLLFSKADPKVPNIPYRMPLLRKIVIPGDEYLLSHFGNLLIRYETTGALRDMIVGPYSFADSHFDPELQTLFLGSAVSGGTEIYAYRLDRPGWKEAYQTQRAHGRLQEIEDNLATLGRQLRAFRAPAYQPAPRKTLAISQVRDTAGYRHVEFARSITLSQKVDDPSALWCRERDRRVAYKETVEDLVRIMAEKEATGENVLVWAGHGNAFFFPLPTFARLLQVAPKHLKGFVFAEMEGTDEHTQAVVEQILFPLAELCRQHGRIILFRNKNIFWNGTCYLPFWSKVLLNERYKDVFVPGLEETNSRTQELSLAGRVGLWQAGYFTHWACRTVTDDANFNRMFEWGGQQLLTHHLRHLVATAALGADMYLSDIHAGVRGVGRYVVDGNDPLARGGTHTGDLYDQLVPFYQLLEKGVIQIPAPDQLISSSDLALVVRTPPSAAYLKHGINGHRFSFPQDQDPEMVFSRMDTYWGGSVTRTDDFSAYAMNVRQRTCNFLPQFPYGLIPIIPAYAANQARFRATITTDGEFFNDGDGQRHTASAHRPAVEQALKAAATRLPLRVEGPAHWSAARLDARHVRLTLVDPGYLDPAARRVEVVFQHLKVKAGRDVLSGEVLVPRQGRLVLTIPAGVFRIIDLELM
ncbi:MAG: PQQ-like beta-propeller repeat protein [Verrucomicrobia bacterium]|nr:PQQ-like beta-propeller repeat protein [Verrucomicrobiota bacterium]